MENLRSVDVFQPPQELIQEELVVLWTEIIISFDDLGEHSQ